MSKMMVAVQLMVALYCAARALVYLRAWHVWRQQAAALPGQSGRLALGPGRRNVNERALARSSCISLLLAALLIVATFLEGALVNGL